MEERDWLERIAAGEEEAFWGFYHHYVHLVFSMALRVLSSRAEAEEVTQEVFLTIWRRAHRYDPARGSPTTWLLTIARRHAIDRLRRGNARPRAVPLLPHLNHPRVSQAPPATHVDLRDALDDLPAEQRRCINLIYFQGCTYREAADVLGVAEGTVKSRVRLALNKLRRALFVLLTLG